MYIRVKASPGAKKESVKEIGDNRFEIAVREPAERNLANSRIMELISERLNVKIGKVRFVSGQRSRNKIFYINTANIVKNK